MPFEISKLTNPIQNYDWGSRTFIAQLQDRPTPSAMPEAELWIGAHPRAPSRLGGPDGPPLDACVAREPESLLGRRCTSKFGPALPFLVKVLAAAHALSIQVHPNSAQAASGFEAENARGLALHAPDRSYADPKRKIELMIALEPVTALCGFRQREEALALL